MLSISVALNALSSHAVCTAVFVAVAAVVGFGIGSIRTLDRIGFLAWIGTVCIITSGETCQHAFPHLPSLTGYSQYLSSLLGLASRIALQQHLKPANGHLIISWLIHQTSPMQSLRCRVLSSPTLGRPFSSTLSLRCVNHSYTPGPLQCARLPLLSCISSSAPLYIITVGHMSRRLPWGQQET